MGHEQVQGVWNGADLDAFLAPGVNRASFYVIQTNAGVRALAHAQDARGGGGGGGGGGRQHHCQDERRGHRRARRLQLGYLYPLAASLKVAKQHFMHADDANLQCHTRHDGVPKPAAGAVMDPTAGGAQSVTSIGHMCIYHSPCRDHIAHTKSNRARRAARPRSLRPILPVRTGEHSPPHRAHVPRVRGPRPGAGHKYPDPARATTSHRRHA